MKRSWRLALTGLLVLAIAGAGLAAALYVASGPEMMARSLTRLLDRHVQIGALVVRTGGNLEVELRDFAIHESLEPTSDVLFSAPRALGTQSWPRLLVGQVLPGHWEIESPVLHVRASGEAALPSLPPVGLRITQGTVLLERTAGSTVRIEGLEVEAERGPLLSGASVGRASGRVSNPRGSLGQFEVEFEGWVEEFSANGSVQDVDLAALPLEPPLGPKGVAGGNLQVSWAAPVLSTSVDLRVSQLALELPDMLAPIAPRDVRLAAQVVWSEDAIVFRPRGLRLDDLEMNGEVRVESGPSARVRVDLRFADFAPGQPAQGRLHPVKLLALRFKTWAALDERVEAGTIHELRIQTNVPRATFAEAFSFVQPLEPEAFTMTARVSGGRYRPSSDASPFENVAVDLSWRGNVLDIAGLHMSRDGEPLPRIDVTVDGMHRLTHLPPEERGVPNGPGVPIPGLATLVESLGSEEEPGTAAASEPEPVIELRDFQIGYPAFVMPIRNARATVRCPPGAIVVEKAQGVIGGAPAQLAAVWDRDDRTIDVDITYLDGDAPPRRDSGALWASGQFDMERLKLGSWPLEQVTGELRARADTIQLPDVRARLAEGQLVARGSIALGRTGAAGIQFNLELVGADAGKTSLMLGMDDALVTGKVEFKGTLAGELAPQRAFLDHADFDLRVRVADGTVRDLPTMVALARVTSGDAGGLFGQPLPYDRMCADFKLQAGKLRTEDFEIRGSALRALVVGEIDIASEENLTDLVVAVFPLQRLESAVEKIPVVGSMVLGKDGGLLALYVHLEGPWTERRASLMGPEPTGWFKRLRELLPGGTPSAGSTRSNGC